MKTCEVCGRFAVPRQHPCRFAKACQCWYGIPCDGLTRAERRKTHMQLEDRA